MSAKLITLVTAGAHVTCLFQPSAYTISRYHSGVTMANHWTSGIPGFAELAVEARTRMLFAPFPKRVSVAWWPETAELSSRKDPQDF